jgi:asparagine synthase (glutamine-hydrolysing)
MCGIAGFINLINGMATDPRIAKDMANRIIHRGPDDSGIWTEGSVALAHRRLSILDLSPAGHQPMYSPCGRFVIVFNGEIYNHRDICKQIESTPYFSSHIKIWRGHSDTEVILAAIACWGLQAALKRMVGMFAIALWDRQERVLSLARDRMGEKPLYFGKFGSTLIFGSELKALRAHPDFRGEVDRGSLSLLMRHNYIPAPYSIYKNVQKVSPASFLTITATGQIQTHRYWSLADSVRSGQRNPFDGGDQEAVDALERCLRLSVRGQMLADVPLGAFLSGGIDSSAIVALMQAQSDRPVRSFSIGFFEKGFNEAEHAKRVAQHIGTDHTELYVTSKQVQDIVPLLPSLYDEPFSDSSQIPTFVVSQLAKQHVKVSLSGDGGDELFGGYNRYFVAGDLWRQMSRMPVDLRNVVATLIRGLSPKAWNQVAGVLRPLFPSRYRHQNVGDKLHKLAGIIGLDGQDVIYRQLVSHWQNPSSLVLDGDEPMTALTNMRQAICCDNFVERMMYLDSISYLPDDILVKVDRAAMGVSLETRVPFLDHRVIEFAWSLPFHMKVRNGEGKWLLKQLLYRHVPKALIERPKMGFGVPIDQLLRGPLRNWAEDLIDPIRLKSEGFFESASIQEKWRQHLSGEQNWQYLLWNVLMFQAWLEQESMS